MTVPDVNLWLRAVARIDPESPRAAWYVQAYDVPAKVAAAKLRGDFDQLVADPEPPRSAFWWRRFRWD